MEHIADFLKTKSLNIAREEAKIDPINPHVAEIVNKLFALFYANCRGFEKQYHDSKRLNLEKTEWMRAFMDLGYKTLNDIQLGIKRLRLESPINTPTIAQFAKWCQPTTEDLGLLSKEDAYNRSAEIMRGIVPEDLSEDQLNIILHAIRQSDRHFLRNNAMSKTQPVFYRNYEIAVKQFMEGKFADIPQGIECREEPQKSVELKDFTHLRVYEANISALKSMLGIRDNCV